MKYINLSKVNMYKAVSKFIEMVQIDSPSGHEQGMIEYVKNWLNKLGLGFQVDSAGNILAKKIENSPPILFCAHMDTVEPGKNIKPFIKNDIIKSSGKTILGADNKAAIAALMAAVEESPNSKSFELLFTVDEENGNGLSKFPFDWIKSKIGFTFDSIKPIGSIILRSPYICLFEVEFSGKASHSSTPEKGTNALIPAINALSEVKIGKLNNGETTINVGLINGGTGINIIPDKFTLKGEIRSYQKNLFEKHIEKIKFIFKKGLLTFSGFAPGYSHKISSDLVKQVIQMYKSLDLNPTPFTYSAVSDANILNSKGIKTINLGDGVKNAHTVKEYIAVNNLLNLQKVIFYLLRKNLWG